LWSFWLPPPVHRFQLLPVSLALYLLFAIATLTSGEIRRSTGRAAATARSGLKRFYPAWRCIRPLITLGILSLTAVLFFLLPRTPRRRSPA